MSVFDYDPETGLPRSPQDWRDTQRNIAETQRERTYAIIDTEGLVYGVTFEADTLAEAWRTAALHGFEVLSCADATDEASVTILIVEPREP